MSSLPSSKVLNSEISEGKRSFQRKSSQYDLYKMLLLLFFEILKHIFDCSPENYNLINSSIQRKLLVDRLDNFSDQIANMQHCQFSKNKTRSLSRHSNLAVIRTPSTGTHVVGLDRSFNKSSQTDCFRGFL